MGSFYQRFMQLCTERNVSPSKVAKEIGLSTAAATGWKNGKIPYDTTIEKIAQYFNVSSDWLNGEDENILKIDSLQIFASDEPTDEAYKQIKKFILTADQDELAETLRYIEFIKSQRKRE